MTRQSTRFLGTLLLAGVLAFSHDLYMMPEKFVASRGAQLRIVFENGDQFPTGVSSVNPKAVEH